MKDIETSTLNKLLSIKVPFDTGEEETEEVARANEEASQLTPTFIETPLEEPEESNLEDYNDPMFYFESQTDTNENEDEDDDEFFDVDEDEDENENENESITTEPETPRTNTNSSGLSLSAKAVNALFSGQSPTAVNNLFANQPSVESTTETSSEFTALPEGDLITLGVIISKLYTIKTRLRTTNFTFKEIQNIKLALNQLLYITNSFENYLTNNIYHP